MSKGYILIETGEDKIYVTDDETPVEITTVPVEDKKETTKEDTSIEEKVEEVVETPLEYIKDIPKEVESDIAEIKENLKEDTDTIKEDIVEDIEEIKSTKIDPNSITMFRVARALCIVAVVLFISLWATRFMTSLPTYTLVYGAFVLFVVCPGVGIFTDIYAIKENDTKMGIIGTVIFFLPTLGIFISNLF